ncbi:hypothetical protein RB195_018029 [Necator americanus]|uniref:Mos1 transposase HTH domain-containing protein n=1 Tax=Necator americanus TaxID=51031 RepID=A0ABR1CBG3_NECAM
MAEHSTHIRHVFLYEFESGHSAAEAHRNLSQVFSTEAPSDRSVRVWFQRFKVGNKKLEDEPRSGRPTALSFDDLKNLVEQHPYEGVRYFASSLGCLLSTVRNVLRNGEKARSRRFDWLGNIVTGDEKWFLYVNHTHKRAWCADDEMPDPFLKGEIREKKIRKEHPKLDNVRQLHDNARPHIAKKTSQKILELGWKVLQHPSHSPDLVLSDYHLFRSLQHHLEEKRYDDRDHLENDLRAFFASKSPEFYAKGICDLVRRWQRIVDVDGDYFDE